MAGIKDILGGYSSLQEFGLLVNAIKPIMIDTETSRDEKRKVLCQLVDKLSEKSFNNSIVLKQIFIIINMKEEECKKFIDTQTQVDSIITWLPRMSEKYNELYKEVSNHRRKFNLKDK